MRVDTRPAAFTWSAAADGGGLDGEQCSCLSCDEILEFAAGRVEPARLDAVSGHLDHCAICLELIAGAVQDWALIDRTLPQPRPLQFAEGDQVGGRYRVERLLGRGGMGEVYAARDVLTGDELALKAVAASTKRRSDAFRRLTYEAQLARRVEHPNVCRVHGWQLHGTVPGEQVPFLTMDLVRGESLKQRLARRPLELDRVEAVARQLLSGLRAIHAAGVMHLDLKSSNVMLAGARGAERAVIVDFGLARAQRQRSARRDRPLSGTLAYMAPELLCGLQPSVKNDVFSFGVVLFEMLTQRLPFESEHQSLESNIRQRLRTRPQAPSRLTPGVPPHLDELVLKCLADPEERYPDVDSTLRALAA